MAAVGLAAVALSVVGGCARTVPVQCVLVIGSKQLCQYIAVHPSSKVVSPSLAGSVSPAR